MKTHKFGTSLILLAFFTSALLTSCSTPQEPIQIAISSWAGVEPAELAAQLGYYEKYGVQVEMVRFSAYSDSIDALREGKVQAGMHTLDDAVRYYTKGSDVRVVLLTDYSYGGDGLVAQAGFESLSDLKGAKIGAEIGTVGHLSLLTILHKANLSVDDVTIISIPAWEIQQEMLKGTIDAGVTWEPYLTSTAEMISGKVLITSRDYPETIITSMVFDAKTIDERPEDVQKVVAAYFDAVDYIAQNPQDAYERMGAAEGISADEFVLHVEGIQYLDLSANGDLFGKNANGRIYAKANEITDFLYTQGALQTKPDINSLLESSFINNLLNTQP
jgi:NitT/TauT family transport system substrate-binding protein